MVLGPQSKRRTFFVGLNTIGADISRLAIKWIQGQH